ncbi:hypothetical protein SAMN05660690_1245 [Geodermatophilus telluris]|uniref:Uncharacterized protein n=1 Tax=Geodermatophilus telluris TaxID=1190417 RepID=A0A1G6L7S6_9ACTN|nr:hypothetical protein [Geodermatophilus telluris]SDC39330.1 hypothetical protein SAMN05660690_1245 [Geodermatophilus telluris]
MQPVRTAPPVESPAPRRSAVRLAAAAAAPVAAACDCGHGKQAHQHYRRGSDCAFCGCARYHRPLLRRLISLAR